MDFKTSLIRVLTLSAFLTYASNAFAEDELRATFFKNVDTALAKATAANAELLAAKSFAKGARAYAAAETGLNRGLQFLRNKTAEAADNYDLAVKTAGLILSSSQISCCLMRVHHRAF